jgi:hypothetical protein
MRYRIQIEQMLDAVIIVVSEYRGDSEYTSIKRNLYTFDGEAARHGGLVEVLSWLTEQVASTAP